MSKKNRERRLQHASERKEQENSEVEKSRKHGYLLKAKLKGVGCDLPFYEVIDSYESEFNRIVAWATSEFRSLHGVFEVSVNDLDDGHQWQRLGIPADWIQIRFDCDEDLAKSYTAEVAGANVRGSATRFRDGDGGLHTVIQVLRTTTSGLREREKEYGMKIPALLHEIGHVKDFEERINFDPDAGKADLIEAEVYANLFALTECFRRGYHICGEFYFDAIVKHKDDPGYLGTVFGLVLERFHKPNYKKWTAYNIAAL